MADDALLPFYSFDTSAIINGMRDIFIPTTFRSIWDEIENMVATGQVRAVDEVKREIRRKSDEARAWAENCRGLFVPLDREIQMATREVLAAHPRLMGKGGGQRNSADPFVIALALARGGTVVTQEQSASLTKPRIPDVCDAMGVPWQTLPAFVNYQGWQFSVGR